MPSTLPDLETRRAAIQMELAGLGDMRSGSITETGGRCGNAKCHCHKPDDPGHGPYYRLTRKVAGKTVTETFPSLAALAKAKREIAEFHRFRELSAELLEVNEQVCRSRPIEEPAALPQEKKTPKSSAGRSRVR